MFTDTFFLTGVIVKEADDVYVAVCLELDVATQGRTVTEAKRKLLEAVTLDLEGAIATHASFWHPVPPDDNPLLTCPEKVVANFPIRVMAWAKPTGL
jgi:predicted RNase H-like HicB family nuclease